jgi:hypothetical protein
MKRVRKMWQPLGVEQSGQIQILILVPILTLLFLSLIVRTASSAIDATLVRLRSGTADA